MERPNKRQEDLNDVPERKRKRETTDKTTLQTRNPPCDDDTVSNVADSSESSQAAEVSSSSAGTALLQAGFFYGKKGNQARKDAAKNRVVSVPLHTADTSISSAQDPTETFMSLRTELLQKEDTVLIDEYKDEETATVVKDVEKNEKIILSKARLIDLSTYRCYCEEGPIYHGMYQVGPSFDPEAFDVEVVQTGFESTITLRCNDCDAEMDSDPENMIDVTSHTRKKEIYSTNCGIIYLSIIDNFGLAGVKRLLVVLDMDTIGTAEYCRYVCHIFDKMGEHYSVMQSKVLAAVRTYYEDHTTNVSDEEGHLKIDISYDCLKIKISLDDECIETGWTIPLGVGVIVEVHTGFILDFEILCKYCVCLKQERKLKLKEISKEAFNAYQLKHQPNCIKNYKGPSLGMETEGAVRLSERSENIKFVYEHFVGNSSTYDAVRSLNGGTGPYKNVEVKKEPISHVQKRTGKLTQNANDIFQSEIWANVKKTKKADYRKIPFLVRKAVLEHNFGCQKASLLKAMKITSQGLDTTLKNQDSNRKEK